MTIINQCPQGFRINRYALKLLSLAVTTTSLSLSVSSAHAASSAATIEEVMVTAQRRSQNLQQVPMAVSAFNQYDLQQLQASDLGDLQNAVPSLTLHEGDAANAVVYIRGVGQIDSLAFADPGVGIYLDDIYLGRAQGAFLTVFDVERIEVLRGPQGTLYGRNTIGGAIKYISTAPSDTTTLDLEATAGNYDRQDIKASISGPLIEDQLLGKLAIAQLTREGYSDNAFDGKDDGDKDTLAWRAGLRWLINDRWQVDLALDSSKDEPSRSRTPSRETPVFGVPANTDPFKVNANFNRLSDLDVFGTGLTISAELTDHWRFKSISSVRSMDYQTELDTDATPQSLFGVFVDQEQEQWSQEFQFSYDNSDTLHAVVGVYYFHEEDDTENGIYGPELIAAGNSLLINSLNQQDNDSAALYAQADYQISESTTLIAGLRYTQEDKTFERQMEAYPNGTPYPLQLGQGIEVYNSKNDDSWSDLSPKLGLEFQANQDVLLYGSISQGFKSGGFDGRADKPEEASPYDPETLTAFETGIKSDWLDQRLRINAALFYNDYEDLQLSSFTADANGGFTQLFSNAGEAHIAGAEFEITALISDSFSLDFNLSVMDSEYDEYVLADGSDVSSQRELVNTPDLSSRLAAQYQLDLGNSGHMIFNADVSYRDKTYTTVSSSEVLAQKSYHLINANISYLTADDHWRITASAKNIEDKRYITHGFDLSNSPGYQLGYYGAPRTYSVTVAYQF